MFHILYGDPTKAKIAILIKENSLNLTKIRDSYITPTKLPVEEFIAFSLHYQSKDKCPAALAKEYIETLLPVLDRMGIKTILLADGLYFKYLTQNKKAEPFYGYVCPCTVKGFEHMQIILAPNYQAILYNPALQQKLDRSLGTLLDRITGSYTAPGTGIIHTAAYPTTVKDIRIWLDKLLCYGALTCDIEARSLKFYSCGVSTISFAWDEHNGIAFAVDRGSEPRKVRALLKMFFTIYTGTLIYHNIGYDGKVLLYQLWMGSLADYPNMLTGLHTMTKNFEDTKLIAYFATNNAVQNELGLKALSAPFTGNYAQEDIKDTDNIPLPELLEYNLTDALATWWVYKKYYPIMVQDQQENVYRTLFKPCVKTLMQTELCGMPIIPERVQEAKQELTAIVAGHMDFFKNSPIIQDFHYGQLVKKAEAATKKAKKKIYKIDDPVIACAFNPNSDQQLQDLIFGYMGYKPIDFTKGKAPSTNAKTIDKLINHATCPEHKKIFEHLAGFGKASIILTTFIPSFEEAQQLPDGSWRMYGSFNLGGTQSLRLSSSNPNLQNIPSGSVYAKLVKKCFGCAPGWLFVGSDMDSLEDKTNALITKDPNKLKVYTDGFDGHSLRAFSYFGDKMPDIRQAKENERCFKLNIGNTDICLKSGDVVKYKNTTYTMEEFYEKVTSTGL